MVIGLLVLIDLTGVVETSLPMRALFGQTHPTPFSAGSRQSPPGPLPLPKSALPHRAGTGVGHLVKASHLGLTMRPTVGPPGAEPLTVTHLTSARRVRSLRVKSLRVRGLKVRGLRAQVAGSHRTVATATGVAAVAVTVMMVMMPTMKKGPFDTLSILRTRWMLRRSGGHLDDNPLAIKKTCLTSTQ